MKLLGHVIKDPISRLEGRLWGSSIVIPPIDIDNVSTPEFAVGMRLLRSDYTGDCFVLRQSFAITGANAGADTFAVSGNWTHVFTAGVTFSVTGSTLNDGPYGVLSSSFSAGSTTITVDSDVVSSIADGNINASEPFGFTSDGDLDTTSIATWLAGSNGYVSTWYDQSGNSRNATQTTLAAQPLYVASGQGGRPMLLGDGTNDYMTIAAMPGLSTYAYLHVYKTVDIEGVLMEFGNHTAPTNYRIISLGVVDKIRAQQGGASALTGTVTLVPGSSYLIMAQGVEAEDYILRTNASDEQTMTNAGAWTSISNTSNLWADSPVNNPVNVYFGEIILWSVALITFVREELERNVNAYWSIY